MSALETAAQSEWLTAISLTLNCLQTIALAWIASRSNRVRSDDLGQTDERRRPTE